MGTPNYPKDMASEWNKLRRDVKNAFTSANLRTGMAKIGARVIEITGTLALNAGATLVARYTNGRSALWIGQSLFNGTPVGQLIIRRFDGSTALQVFGGTGEPGYFSIHDRTGNIIMSDDAGSSIGLARPWLPYHTVDYWHITQPVHTSNNSTFAKHHAVMGQAQHPKITIFGYMSSTVGTDVSEVRLVDNGNGNVLATASSTGSNWVTLTANHPDYEFGRDFWYDIEVRRVSGSGNVGYTPTRAYGRQT